MASSQSQRKVLISGGARGIGRCVTRQFCERGDKVYIFDIDEDELSHTVNTHLKKFSENGSLGYGICNLRDTNEIRKTVEGAATFLDKKIDVLVLNGSIAAPKWKDGKTMESFETLDEWRAYMDTNLTSIFAVSQASIPYMKAADPDSSTTAKTSSIIQIGSFRAHQSDLNQEGYASSKAGQLGLMHSMAISLSHLGIRVNCVSPGRIKVEHESKEGDEKGKDWEGQNEKQDVDDHPVNRAGMPEDIADAVEYLAGAGFVSGQEIIVDGGAVRKKS